MRFHLGQPPATPNFSPQEEGWTPLKEPSPMVFTCIGTPLGIVAAALIASAWGGSNARIEVSSSSSGPLVPLFYLLCTFGIGIPALIAAHELLHAFGYPKFGFTDSTMIAFWPSMLLFLAISFDALRRNHLLFVYMLPLLVISILPVIICRSLGIASLPLMLASIFNSMIAGGDIFCFFLILSQVPRNAILRNQGWATWWKVVEQ